MRTTRFTRAAAIGLAGIATTFAAQRTDNQFHPLAKTHRWFELRAAANDRTPPLIRGALAAAFNDPASAERLLREVIRTAANSEAADDAYAMLARVYIRSGQYERFATLFETWAAAIPASAAVRDERENFDKFRDRPNQINGERRRSAFRHGGNGYLTLPVSVDGKKDDFVFDTGAWQSALTERTARKLGLLIRDDGRTLTDVSGTRTPFRIAVAKEVVVGAMTFRDVSFAVIAGGGAFADRDLGIIGMPIILAMGGIGWSKNGTVEFGGTFPASGVREPNLVFDGRLVLRAEVLGRNVLLAVDTGATATDLNANFADTFPSTVAQGKKGTADVIGIGGKVTFQSMELPELIFTVAGRRALLRPAVVTMQRNSTAGGDCCVGNTGLDLLRQGRGLTIDLSAMTLQLH